MQWLALSGGLVAVVTFVADRRERTRAEAAGVYVIVTRFLPVTRHAGGYTFYEIVNDGQLPALRVSVSGWTWGARRRFAWRLRPIGSWMTGRRIPAGVFPQVLPQSRTDEHDMMPLSAEGDVPGERPPIMLVFRDGYGRSWVRWPDGRLNRLSLSRYQARRRRKDRPKPQAAAT